MRSRPSALLVLLVLLALSGLGGGAWLVLVHARPSGPAPAPIEPLAPSPRNGAGEPVAAHAPVVLENTQTTETVVAPAGYPIEVDLELVRADASTPVKGATALGSAATARLRGSVVSGVGAPVAAEVLFEHGPNQGRVLQCDPTGRFGATNLYPGLAVVRVRGTGIPGSQRIVRLRQKTEFELNLGYGRLSEITGEVITRDALPLQGARVSFDGQEAVTDPMGLFHFDGVASGQALVTVLKPGYAGLVQELTVPAGKKIEKGQLRFPLDKGARLVIEVPDRIRSDVETYCFLLADSAPGTLRSYPWFLVNPVRVWPGGSKTVEDLPPGTFTLRLFQAGAMAKPSQKSVKLDVGGEAQVTLNLEPAPTIHGIVRLNGQPVQKAEVTLEAADRLAATLAAFGAPNEFFVENDVLPEAPPAIQHAFTDAAGSYEVSSWVGVARERYLVARYDGGRQIATVFLHGGEEQVDLDLHTSAAGDGLLRLVLSARDRPLPVRIAVNGEARPVQQLPVGQDLRVPDLNRGQWKLSVRYNGNTLAAGKEIEIGAETAVPMELPR